MLRNIDFTTINWDRISPSRIRPHFCKVPFPDFGVEDSDEFAVLEKTPELFGEFWRGWVKLQSIVLHAFISFRLTKCRAEARRMVFCTERNEPHRSRKRIDLHESCLLKMGVEKTSLCRRKKPGHPRRIKPGFVLGLGDRAKRVRDAPVHLAPGQRNLAAQLLFPSPARQKLDCPCSCEGIP